MIELNNVKEPQGSGLVGIAMYTKSKRDGLTPAKSEAFWWEISQIMREYGAVKIDCCFDALEIEREFNEKQNK